MYRLPVAQVVDGVYSYVGDFCRIDENSELKGLKRMKQKQGSKRYMKMGCRTF